MKKVSFRLSDSEYRQIETNRGAKTTSKYLRDMLVLHLGNDEKESAAFQRLFNDVSTIKDSIDALLKAFPNKEALLAVVGFLAHAMTIGNPTAYAHHTSELKQLFQTLKATVSNGGEQ
jgi:hypothetical protein